jgi:hypothetical protein
MMIVIWTLAHVQGEQDVGVIGPVMMQGTQSPANESPLVTRYDLTFTRQLFEEA